MSTEENTLLKNRDIYRIIDDVIEEDIAPISKEEAIKLMLEYHILDEDENLTPTWKEYFSRRN